MMRPIVTMSTSVAAMMNGMAAVWSLRSMRRRLHCGPMQGGETLLASSGQAIRVAVLGAGAVGCYYGGRRARAGHRVTLIGRPVHVEAFRKSGLHFEGQKFHERVAVEASTEAAAVRGGPSPRFFLEINHHGTDRR